MQLIVISSPAKLTDEVPVLHRLFESGLEYFHLRKPLFSRQDMQDYMKRIDPGYHNCIVLHSHYELQNEYNIKGIHYTQIAKERNETAERFYSASIHELYEIDKVLPSWKYAFLSPVFDSISKPGYKSFFPPLELANHLKKKRKATKVIALGGINSKNIESANKLGFDGVALLGCLWNNMQTGTDLIDNFKRIQAQCR